MEKLKWKYDKKHKQWYVCETKPRANDGCQICKSELGTYNLDFDMGKQLHGFKKLSSAKEVARLCYFG